MNQAFNMDCMEAMKEFPDDYFDLAVVDPPYGGGCSQNVQVERERELHGGTADFEQRKRSRFGGLFDRYHIGGQGNGGTVCEVRNAENRGYL